MKIGHNVSMKSKGVTLKGLSNGSKMIFYLPYTHIHHFPQVALTDSGGSYEAGLSTVQAVRQVVVRVTYRLTAWMGIGQMSMFTCRGCHTWLRRTCLCLMLCPAPILRTSQYKYRIGPIRRKYLIIILTFKLLVL